MYNEIRCIVFCLGIYLFICWLLWNIFYGFPWRLGLDGLLVTLTAAFSMARCCRDVTTLEEGRRWSNFRAPALSCVDQCMRLQWFRWKVCNQLPPFSILLYLWWEETCWFQLHILPTCASIFFFVVIVAIISKLLL